jgi:hypothetical protein
MQEYLISASRKRIEIMLSQISVMFPKRIHAVTVDGFLIKLVLFIFVFTLNKLLFYIAINCSCYHDTDFATFH